MQIDWLTVTAQVANFLILVWLLQRFLYRPIIAAMQRREKLITDRLDEAQTARQSAEEEAAALQEKQDELEAEKEAILQKARDDAAELKEQLTADIQEDMDDRHDTWRQHLQEERDEFANTLRRHAGHQVIAIAEEMLKEYARSDISMPVAEGFIAQLNALDSEKHDKMVKASAHTNDAALVESGIVLNSAARAKVTRAIHVAFSTDIDVEYAQDDDVVLGVRLTIGEQTLEWSAARHLQRLDSALDEAIDSVGPPHKMASGAAENT